MPRVFETGNSDMSLVAFCAHLPQLLCQQVASVTTHGFPQSKLRYSSRLNTGEEHRNSVKFQASPPMQPRLATQLPRELWEPGILRIHEFASELLNCSTVQQPLNFANSLEGSESNRNSKLPQRAHIVINILSQVSVLNYAKVELINVPHKHLYDSAEH